MPSGFNYAGLVREDFFSITKSLSSPPSYSIREEHGKKILEKCPRKEKTDRLPEGVSIPLSQPVRGDFLPKATRGVWPNPL